MDDAMSAQLIDLLRKTTLFGSLSDEALQAIVVQFESIELPDDSVLFAQGDASDYLYILVGGKLISLLNANEASEKIIGYIKPGETVGEMGVLTQETRSLTVKAVEESQLLKLSRQSFTRILTEYPAIVFDIIRPIVQRSQKVIHLLSEQDKSSCIVVLNATANALTEEFFANFATLRHVQDKTFLFDTPQTNRQETAELLSILQTKGKTITCFLKSPYSKIAKLALEHCSKLYLVEDGSAKATFSQEIKEVVANIQAQNKEVGLILLQRKKQNIPTNTVAWLDLVTFSAHFQFCMTEQMDYLRLIRYFLGKSIALVLSGGGAKTWAHIGVIKALTEQKVPIDLISGTGMGAVVAACYAMHNDAEKLHDSFSIIAKALITSLRWRHISWPRIALFNGKAFTHALKEVFAERHIEDLWLPYFCMSSNLTTNAPYLHHRGLLWQATRASNALPGLFPPMTMDGMLHVDGGLVDNLPTDAMRDLVGKYATVIAVDLDSMPQKQTHYDFPPVLTLLKTFLSRKNKENYPHGLDTYVQSLYIGAHSLKQRNTLLADALINPDLSLFHYFELLEGQEQELIDVGYQAAMGQLGKLNLDTF